MVFLQPTYLCIQANFWNLACVTALSPLKVEEGKVKDYYYVNFISWTLQA